MNTAAAAAFKPPSFALRETPPPPNSSNHNPPRIRLTRTKPNRSISVGTVQTSDPISKHTAPPPPPDFSVALTSINVGEKLKILVSEFKSMSEPVDRVKRLLHYASLLPEFEGSGRVETNRVKGCTAQVWLEVMMDSDGLMRFRMDSDSEITKGFCYCLIWLLDGADPEEVLEVDIDDLGEMNVGSSPIRASSRVHTWHNVLISMQRRTQALITEKYDDPSLPMLS